MRQSIKSLKREGFRYEFTLSSPEDVAAEVVRTPLWTDKTSDRGPFDIIGDIHGCFDELVSLLEALDYQMYEGSKPLTSNFKLFRTDRDCAPYVAFVAAD